MVTKTEITFAGTIAVFVIIAWMITMWYVGHLHDE